MSEQLVAALRYARADWPVFPCRPRGKVPLFPRAHDKGDSCRGECGRIGHGVLDATTDEATIVRWWTARPDANVAIATGTPAPDVVDIDCKRGAPGPASYARLRDAGLLRGAHAIVVTPSGGWHLYYVGSDQGNAALARHGVDFRGRGGYVLAPPSYVVDREHGYADRYRLREWREPSVGVDFAAIRRYLDPPPRPARARPGRRSDQGTLVRWVARQGAGNRNNALFYAACRSVDAGATDEADLRDLVDAAVSTGLTERAALATVRSALERRART